MAPRLMPFLFFVLVGCQVPQQQEFKEVLYSQLPDRPYSGAVRVGDAYFFAGKIGVTDSTLAMSEDRIPAEVHNIMEAFRAQFDELGLAFSDVVQANVFLTDIADYDAMNRAYGEYFPENPPARSTAAVSALPGDAAVEIAFIAVRSPQGRGP